MRVFKDDEMIAEITGTEVGESSSFEEPILLLICTEFAFQAFRSEIEDTFEALHSGSQFKCTVKASSSCCELLFWGHVPMSCSEVMLRGHGLRPWSKAWSTVMFQGHVRQSRSEVMLWGDIWRPCFEDYEGNDKFWGVSIVNWIQLVAGHLIQQDLWVVAEGRWGKWIYDICCEDAPRQQKNGHWIMILNPGI